MLQIKGLTKTFPRPKQKRARRVRTPRPQNGKHFYAVRNVTFQAEKAKILGLLGPNGAGKTTLLRMLSTALKPTAGTAVFDGIDLIKSPLDVRAKIGFLSDNTGLYGRLTAREMIEYFGSLHAMDRRTLKSRVDELFDVLDMTDFADKRNDDLSSGMKQKVSIARTLVHDPDVIMIDEPTTGLDVAAAEAILDFIKTCRDNGKTILFCTHHMHEVERLCDSVVILYKGRLCFHGTIEQMRSDTGETHLDKAFLDIINSAEPHDEL